MRRADWHLWLEAIIAEIGMLVDYETWIAEDKPEGANVVGSNIILKRKRDGNGKIKKYKARLVAQGFSQVHGIDYHDTYSPVVRLDTIRLLIALAAHYNLDIHGMDIVGAYLNGKLEETIYMRQPPILNDGTGQVLRLKKTLYGLKQSGRVWNNTLNNTFTFDLGYTRLIADRCVYVRQSPKGPIIAAVHVDDIFLLTPRDAEIIAQVKNEIKGKFNATDLGELHHTLGMEITRDEISGNITLSQTQYTKKIIQRMGMENCNPVEKPLDTNVKLLNKHTGTSSDDDRQYYMVGIGSLIFLSKGSRPDITYAVQHLAQFSQNPGPAHITALKHLFRYLKGSPNLGITYGNSDLNLRVYSDADWGNDLTDRKSISGYVCKLGGGAITWSSKKQPTVAKSTMEAEYMALSHAVSEVLWLRSLLNEINIPQPTIPINVDNQSAIKFGENPMFHARSKHIDIKHHFIRDHLASNEVRLLYCASADNLADMLTKALPTPQFRFLSNSVLGNQS